MKAIILALLSLFVSCAGGGEKSIIVDASVKKYQYITIRRKGRQIDTFYKAIKEQGRKDSCWRIVYESYDEGDTFYREYYFPITKNGKWVEDRDLIELLSVKDIQYSGKTYKVYKLFYDEYNCVDEETLFFVVPEYGIVLGKSLCWGGYERLISNGVTDDKDDIFYIVEMILGDAKFFQY